MSIVTAISTTIAILRFIRTNNSIFANYRIFTGFLQLVEILRNTPRRGECLKIKIRPAE